MQRLNRPHGTHPLVGPFTPAQCPGVVHDTVRASAVGVKSFGSLDDNFCWEQQKLWPWLVNLRGSAAEMPVSSGQNALTCGDALLTEKLGHAAAGDREADGGDDQKITDVDQYA
ncbi:hypothetical protein Afe04nite_44020 [Asanoa ferruginea]|nr:hypothetical protein Afe04nite_44020 [Asanoa ferruginea]